MMQLLCANKIRASASKVLVISGGVLYCVSFLLLISALEKMMKKTFAPPVTKPHVLSLRKGPEHHGKKEDVRAKEAITYPLSQGPSDSTETKLKAGYPDTDVKRWKKSRVGEEEDTGRVKGPETVRDSEKRAKRNSSKVSMKVI